MKKSLFQPTFRYHLDTDRDGVEDFRDCRPFNYFLQHVKPNKLMEKEIKKLHIKVAENEGYSYPLFSKEAERYAPRASREILSAIKKSPSLISEIRKTGRQFKYQPLEMNKQLTINVREQLINKSPKKFNQNVTALKPFAERYKQILSNESLDTYSQFISRPKKERMEDENLLDIYHQEYVLLKPISVQHLRCSSNEGSMNIIPGVYTVFRLLSSFALMNEDEMKDEYSSMREIRGSTKYISKDKFLELLGITKSNADKFLLKLKAIPIPDTFYEGDEFMHIGDDGYFGTTYTLLNKKASSLNYFTLWNKSNNHTSRWTSGITCETIEQRITKVSRVEFDKNMLENKLRNWVYLKMIGKKIIGVPMWASTY
jgi:hypothetical protein